jgi:hypothetical protein
LGGNGGGDGRVKGTTEQMRRLNRKSKRIKKKSEHGENTKSRYAICMRVTSLWMAEPFYLYPLKRDYTLVLARWGKYGIILGINQPPTPPLLPTRYFPAAGTPYFDLPQWLRWGI